MSREVKRDVRVSVSIRPGTDTGIFRLPAADDVVRLLADAHEAEFTMSELTAQTEYSRSTVWRAVGFLEELGVVTVREAGRNRHVAIDPSALQKDDPILGVPQAQFHDPIRQFVERVEQRVETSDEVDELLGVVVFGSVARGGADRKSDVDVFVVVTGHRTTARRLVSAVADELGTERFDGERYAFEPFVESAESVGRIGTELREQLTDGVTVYRTDAFDRIRAEVMAGER